MIRIIETTPTHFIQKVVTTKGNLISYQVVPKDGIGDTANVQHFGTLSEARSAAFVAYKPPVVLTPSKMSYAQNQMGYRARPKGGKK